MCDWRGGWVEGGWEGISAAAQTVRPLQYSPSPLLFLQTYCSLEGDCQSLEYFILHLIGYIVAPTCDDVALIFFFHHVREM